MIAVICLAIAAALLFWPEKPLWEEAASQPFAPSSSKTSAKPKRRRREAPKNERKE